MRTFTTEFKQDAVRIFEAGERTIAEVSRSLDVTPSVLRAWVKQHVVDAGKGTPGALTTTERDELARLRRENRQLIHRHPWPTRITVRDAIANYIEMFYNPHRRHSALGYVSPAEFERRKQPVVILAA